MHDLKWSESEKKLARRVFEAALTAPTHPSTRTGAIKPRQSVMPDVRLHIPRIAVPDAAEMRQSPCPCARARGRP